MRGWSQAYDEQQNGMKESAVKGIYLELRSTMTKYQSERAVLHPRFESNASSK
jgi:hypothetical protein